MKYVIMINGKDGESFNDFTKAIHAAHALWLKGEDVWVDSRQELTPKQFEENQLEEDSSMIARVINHYAGSKKSSRNKKLG